MRQLMFLILGLIVFASINCKNDTDDYDKDYLSDLLILNDGSMICSKMVSGIFISKDGGIDWKKISDEGMKKLVVDEKNTLWGIDAWEGIHEESYSRIYCSNDTGKTWAVTEFDTRKFFPTEIVSKPYGKFKIMDHSNKIYELRGSNVYTDWILTDTLKPNKKLNYLAEYELHDEKLQLDSIYFNIKSLSICLDYIEYEDSLMIAGGANDGRAFLGVVFNNRLIRRFDIEGVQATDVKKDFQGRIWVITGGNLFLKGKLGFERRF